MDNNGATVIADAIVEFTDGHLARFTRVEMLDNGTLQATLSQSFDVRTGDDSSNSVTRVNAVDTAFYGPTTWRSVHPPRRGTLMVLKWISTHDGATKIIRECVMSNITEGEAADHATKWLTPYLPKESIDRLSSILYNQIDVNGKYGIGSVNFYMLWPPTGQPDDINRESALEARAQIDIPEWGPTAAES